MKLNFPHPHPYSRRIKDKNKKITMTSHLYTHRCGLCKITQMKKNRLKIPETYKEIGLFILTYFLIQISVPEIGVAFSTRIRF
jgi:hypothetical protein